LNRRGWTILAVFTLVAMGAVAWLGQQYSNQARALLHGLRRIV
jgi:hypothetical protein